MYDPITTFHIARRHGEDLVAEAEHRRLARRARRGRRGRGAGATVTTSLNRIRPPAPAA